mgnify:CR=1 FL=1
MRTFLNNKYLDMSEEYHETGKLMDYSTWQKVGFRIRCKLWSTVDRALTMVGR